MKKTKINLLERIMLLMILPKEGKFETLVISKGLEKKLAISTKELADYKIISLENGSTKWNDKGSKAFFEYVFVELENLLIKEQLMKASKEEKLSIELIGLYEQFVK